MQLIKEDKNSNQVHVDVPMEDYPNVMMKINGLFPKRMCKITELVVNPDLKNGKNHIGITFEGQESAVDQVINDLDNFTTINEINFASKRNLVVEKKDTKSNSQDVTKIGNKELITYNNLPREKSSIVTQKKFTSFIELVSEVGKRDKSKRMKFPYFNEK